ncbi:hypothetical protein [Nocardioides sambongensis]|uniref:hypothetical protein n=1 Tax=Nocardioides sambongensis TaxID=2589074 RepID=UPI0015E830F3|nr:hypothetical protein [Nocardioides sambongensis]
MNEHPNGEGMLPPPPAPAPTGGDEPGRHRDAGRVQWLSPRNRVVLVGALLLLLLCVGVPVAAQSVAAEPADGAADTVTAEAILTATRSTAPAPAAEVAGSEVAEGSVADERSEEIAEVVDPGTADTASAEEDGSVVAWLGVGLAVAAFCLLMVRDGRDRS